MKEIREALTTREVKEAIGRFRGVAQFFDYGDMSAESDGLILADAIGAALVALDRLAASKSTGYYSIEPHGDAFALYRGRDLEHHGANLCRLSDFDYNGEATRAEIVQALNAARLAAPGEDARKLAMKVLAAFQEAATPGYNFFPISERQPGLDEAAALIEPATAKAREEERERCAERIRRYWLGDGRDGGFRLVGVIAAIKEAPDA